jgi:uncharacterized membrane protein YfcA
MTGPGGRDRLAPVDASEVALLIGGGLAAGVINTLAGGGSLLTVPLLVLFGLPGGIANGTNRIGILIQSIVASWSFRAEGVRVLREALPILWPLGIGSAVGAVLISNISDEVFERIFGLLMLVLLIPTLWPRRRRSDAEPAAPWSRSRSFAVFAAIGVYAGAVQAGVGLAILFALTHAGFDLVRANAIKMLIVGIATLVVIPVFIFQGQVAWVPAMLLALGFGLGGAVGARLAVAGGEKLIRPVVALAVVALAGRMLGVY